MRVISFRDGERSGVGVVTGEEGVIDVGKVAPDLPSTLREIIAADPSLDSLRKATDGKPSDYTFNDITFNPVITDANALWALALNFQTHINETGLTTSPDYPHIFLRHAGSHVGHKQPLVCPHPDVAKAYDHEGELAVIIGRSGRHIPIEKALEHVAGYSIHNEGSVREFQGHNRQFGLGKNFGNSGSFGPWLMTPDEFGDPYAQELIVRLNGYERQRESLSHLMFNVERLINYLSTGYRLHPGDVIITGTPGQLPPQPGQPRREEYGRIKIDGLTHMRPGDTVEVEVTGLGILKNPVIGDVSPEYDPG